MRRQEFEDDITTFDELWEFCENYGYESFFDDFYDECSADDRLSEMFVDMIREYGWQDARDSMNNQDSGYSWYREDGWGDLVGCDGDDFDGLKERVLCEADDDEVWDEDEPVDEEYEPEPEPEYGPCVQDEDAAAVDVDGLLAVNSQLLVEMAPAACACEEGAEGEQPPENEEEDDGCGDDGEDEYVSIYDLFLPSEIINVGTESA